MQGIIAHPFSAIAGAVAGGFALLVAYPASDARAIPNVACSVVPAAAIARAAGRPVRLAPTDGGVCRYLGTDSALEITTSVVAQAPDLPFDASAARVDLPDGSFFVVRVRDESSTVDPERLAVRVADLAAERATKP